MEGGLSAPTGVIGAARRGDCYSERRSTATVRRAASAAGTTSTRLATISAPAAARPPEEAPDEHPERDARADPHDRGRRHHAEQHPTGAA
jgi:hypothetical protein